MGPRARPLGDPGVVGEPLAAASLGGVDGQVQAALEQVELGGQVGDRGAQVAPVAVQLVAVHRRARGQQRREQVALERRRLAGRTWSSTDGSSTYTPALIRSVTQASSSGPGFSRKAVTRSSSSTGTRPKALGSGTRTRARVAAAWRSLCSATSRWKSMSTRTTPLRTRKVPSSRWARRLTAPEVPIGVSSEDRTTSTPALRLRQQLVEGLGQVHGRQHTSVNPRRRAGAGCGAGTALAKGISGLGRVLVRGGCGCRTLRRE